MKRILAWLGPITMVTGLGFFIAGGPAPTNAAPSGMAPTSAARAYVPDAKTVVEVDGGSSLGWTLELYDRTVVRFPAQRVELDTCAKRPRVAQQVRCMGAVNQRNRDFYKLQQGLAYAHALADR